MEHVGSFNFGRSHRFRATSIRLLLICTDLVKYICLPHFAEPWTNLYLWINTHTLTGSQIVHTKLMAWSRKYGRTVNSMNCISANILHYIKSHSYRHQMEWNKRDEASYSWRSLVATLVCAKHIRAACNTNVCHEWVQKFQFHAMHGPNAANTGVRCRSERSCCAIKWYRYNYVQIIRQKCWLCRKHLPYGDDAHAHTHRKSVEPMRLIRRQWRHHHRI